MFWLTFFVSYLASLYAGWLFTKEVIEQSKNSYEYQRGDKKGQFPWGPTIAILMATPVLSVITATILAWIWPLTLTIGLGAAAWYKFPIIGVKLTAARKWAEDKLSA